MIELPKEFKELTTKDNKNTSTLYNFIIGLAVYHLIIFIGFALASFVTMENHFVHISFFDWSEGGRIMYVVCYIPLIALCSSVSIKDNN